MSSKDIFKQWFAFYTKSRHEKSVSIALENKGFEVYLPLLKERRKWSDRKKWVTFPLFKSYIFIKIEAKESVFALKTPGIVKIIKFGDKPSPILDDTIKSLKLMIEGGYNPQPIEYFTKGDPVIIRDGPLKGLKGEIGTIHNQDHFIIHIDAIQHSVSIKINRAYLSSL
tara:strand:- start:1728 stop:2234 length:507 start_codon:yes stop_codon:yes gene_type:complete